MYRGMAARLALALSVCVGAGCSSGGGGSGGSASCESVNTASSYLNGQCTGCDIADQGAVADGSLFSFADITPTMANSDVTISAGTGGTEITAGGEAGVFMTQSLPAVV